METTEAMALAGAGTEERLEEELAVLTAHINAATARWLDLVAALRREGGPACDDLARWLAFRFGMATREAREYLRVAEALEELPSIREAFSRGELTFTKVRALTRVATRAAETSLLELAAALTASQLERALRAFRRLASEQAGEAHELEYVDYSWGEDGSLFVRARLAAEDGAVLVRALEAAGERVRNRRRDEQPSSGGSRERAERELEPARSVRVEALVELAQTALLSPEDRAPGLMFVSKRPRVLSGTLEAWQRRTQELGARLDPRTRRPAARPPRRRTGSPARRPARSRAPLR